MVRDNRVRVRALPDGEAREGWQGAWTGALVDIDFADESAGPAWPTGTRVEVEAETAVYLGTVRESRPSGVCVLVEHSLERSQVGWVQDVWG